jgi:hypothetical protein
MAGERFAPGVIALAARDGSVRQVADGLAFPNGILPSTDTTDPVVTPSVPCPMSRSQRAYSPDQPTGRLDSVRLGLGNCRGRVLRRARRCSLPPESLACSNQPKHQLTFWCVGPSGLSLPLIAFTNEVRGRFRYVNSSGLAAEPLTSERAACTVRRLRPCG